MMKMNPKWMLVALTGSLLSLGMTRAEEAPKQDANAAEPAVKVATATAQIDPELMDELFVNLGDDEIIVSGSACVIAGEDGAVATEAGEPHVMIFRKNIVNVNDEELAKMPEKERAMIERMRKGEVTPEELQKELGESGGKVIVMPPVIKKVAIVNGKEVDPQTLPEGGKLQIPTEEILKTLIENGITDETILSAVTKSMEDVKAQAEAPATEKK